MKKIIFKVFAFILVILIMAGCSHNREEMPESKKGTLTIERELIEEKALAASKAIYSGDKNYLKQVSMETNLDYFQELIDLNKNIKLKSAKVNSYDKKEEDFVIITILIDDSKGKVYHQYVFKKISGEWIIAEFGVDL